MGSLYNMGNLTAVKDVSLGGVGWGMHEGVVVVGVEVGGEVYDWK